MKKLATVALCALALNASAVLADSYKKKAPRNYEITITNVTKGQAFTPILAASHRRSISFFELGAPASEPLAALAESGNIAPLQAVLQENSRVVSSTASSEGLLMPGQSTTISLTADRSVNRVSLAAMLIPTNDTFMAINTVSLPFRGTRTVFARAYDAGSETNDEICANIPGPVCQGAGPSPDDAGEGFVHISSGISGEGELSQSQYDWRDAVAKITITRK